MGEMLDVATEKAKGQQEKQQVNKPKVDSKDPIAEMEVMLAQETDVAKREYYNSKLREMKVESDLRARDNQARLLGPPVLAAVKPSVKDGEVAVEEDEDEREAKKKARAKKEMATIAMDLITRGVDPMVVSQYLAGGIATPMLGGGQAQGLTIKDLISLMTFFQTQNKGNEAITALVQEMRNEIREMRLNPPHSGNGGSTPPAPAFHWVIHDGKVDKVEAGAPIFVDRPVPVPVSAPATSDPEKAIEMEKEKNRHAEEMARLGTEQQYKEGMVGAVGNLIEGVGAGFGKEMLKAKPVASTTGTATESFPCQKCGALVVGPKGAPRIKCVKCGQEYMDQSLVKQPSVSPAPPPPAPSAQTVEASEEAPV
jgi:hypothetical protein